MSSTQIDHVFARNPHYAGCVSKDELSTAAQLGERFTVVNMQDSDKGQGTHWVLLYNCRPREVIYFDSMGEVPPKSVARIMKQTKKKTFISPYQLQSMGSVTCGYFCVVMAQALEGGGDYHHLLHTFDLNSTAANERAITKHFT